MRTFLVLPSRRRREDLLSCSIYLCKRGINIFEAVENNFLEKIDVNNIRNFSVIAHVDHGKSTLSDAILQLTGNISEIDRKKGQVLDTLKVERERGITVKANTASMIYEDSRSNQSYLLNLIDTPGHIDFTYEVSRSLASCQGALLLVDATQSIQAQTLSNHAKAKALGLGIIPVVTKIDLPNAQPVDAALTMATTFQVDAEDVIMTSAKKSIGISSVLQAIIDKLPSPEAFCQASTQAFSGRIVDSWFDEHRGVVCLLQVVSGSIAEGEKISMYASLQDLQSNQNTEELGHKTEFSVQEIGILTPLSVRTKRLFPGQVGYMIAGLRSTRQARIGDTIFLPAQWMHNMDEFKPLPGYESAKPMLYASIYPVDSKEYDDLLSAVDKLLLNDSSVSVSKEQSFSLGSGLRCGFLGFLHMEVFNQRLKDEFDIEVVMTTPSVPYKIQTVPSSHHNADIEIDESEAKMIHCVSEWPEYESKFHVFEPIVKVTIITPQNYFGAIIDVMKERRGNNVSTVYLDDGSMLITADIPWQEVVCDMHDQIKHMSAGYASFNYENIGYVKADLAKVDIAVNGDHCDALSFVAHRSKAADAGRKMAVKLKEVLTRQQFEIVIQAKVGNKVLARERIAPYRKDVLSKSGKTVGGGDISRKKKLLEKQKEGKKRSKMVGKVEIGQEAFWTVLQR